VTRLRAADIDFVFKSETIVSHSLRTSPQAVILQLTTKKRLVVNNVRQQNN